MFRMRELFSQKRGRAAAWTNSVAAGNRGFIQEVKGKLGTKATSRKMIGNGDSMVLQEPRPAYNVSDLSYLTAQSHSI